LAGADRGLLAGPIAGPIAGPTVTSDDFGADDGGDAGFGKTAGAVGSGAGGTRAIGAGTAGDAAFAAGAATLASGVAAPAVRENDKLSSVEIFSRNCSSASELASLELTVGADSGADPGAADTPEVGAGNTAIVSVSFASATLGTGAATGATDGVSATAGTGELAAESSVAPRCKVSQPSQPPATTTSKPATRHTARLRTGASGSGRTSLGSPPRSLSDACRRSSSRNTLLIKLMTTTRFVVQFWPSLARRAAHAARAPPAGRHQRPPAAPCGRGC
jgi:hypothetical protein